MLLVTGPSDAFPQFIRVLGCIVLLLLTAIILLTVFLHYRRKKRRRAGIEETETDFVLALPEQFSHKKGDGEYVFFDHSRLISEYKKRMFYNHARFIALKKDYASLELKYASLAGGNTPFLNPKSKVSMKPAETFPQTEQPAGETEELIAQLELADKTCRRLEEENRFLQEQITLQDSSSGENDKIIAAWKEERAFLKNTIREQEYLGELLEEKKSQIGFLQTQVEQRIKSQHLANQERQQAMEEKEDAIRQLDAARQELSRQTEALGRLQETIAGKEELLAAQELRVQQLSAQVIYLGNELKAAGEQHELLHAESMDNRDIAMTLRQEADAEKERTALLAQRLEKNRQTLKRLQQEIAACIETETVHSPVVGLSAVFPVAEEKTGMPVRG